MEQASGPNQLSEASKKRNRCAMEDTNGQEESPQDVDMVDLKTAEEYQKEEYDRYYREEEESARQRDLEKDGIKKIKESLFSLYDDLKAGYEELDQCDSSFYQGLIPLILRDGMVDFTNEIGFVFHKNHFEMFCTVLGTERAKAAIHESILTALASLRVVAGENKTLQDLVIAAATNEEISVDGLYMLIRMEPALSLLAKPALENKMAK